MCQLNEVSARTYASMFGNHRIDSSVKELDEQVHYLDVDSGMSLYESHKSGKNSRSDIFVAERVTCTGRMASDDVVL